MKTTSKLFGAAAAAALAAATAAAPAQARHDDRRGIDAGDIATGVAVIGGIAVLASILDDGDDRYRDRRHDRYGRYGYPAAGYGSYGYDRYGYGSQQAAVNVCAREAGRYGRNVRVTDVDRKDGLFRVRGRVDVLDRNDSRWNRPDFDRERFTCRAANGRIYDFRV